MRAGRGDKAGLKEETNDESVAAGSSRTDGDSGAAGTGSRTLNGRAASEIIGAPAASTNPNPLPFTPRSDGDGEVACATPRCLTQATSTISDDVSDIPPELRRPFPHEVRA